MNYFNSTFEQKVENVSSFLSIPKSTFEKKVQFCNFNNVYSIPDKLINKNNNWNYKNIYIFQ